MIRYSWKSSIGCSVLEVRFGLFAVMALCNLSHVQNLAVCWLKVGYFSGFCPALRSASCVLAPAV